MAASYISWVPLFLAAMLFGGLAKLAAAMTRRIHLEWTQAWLFGGLTYLVCAAGTFAYRFSGVILPQTVTVALALVLQIGAGGWYLGARATTRAGKPLVLGGGVLLTLSTYVLAIGCAGLAAAIFRFA